MNPGSSQYRDFHAYYRESRLYLEWTKALDDYGIVWEDITTHDDPTIRLSLTGLSFDMILLTEAQRVIAAELCASAFGTLPGHGIIGFSDGSFELSRFGKMTKCVLKWCDHCQRAFFGGPYGVTCDRCDEDDSSWVVEEGRLTWFGFSGPVHFHPVDVEAYSSKRPEDPKEAWERKAREAIENFRKSPSSVDAEADTSACLFSAADANSAASRQDGSWEGLRTTLSKPPRSHGWPQVQAIEELATKYPNFAEVCEHILTEVNLGPYRKNAQMRIPNILVVGSPSCGKSSFFERLAQILAPGDWESFDLGHNPPDFELVGTDSGYTKAKEGRVLRLLASTSGSPVRNPVLILDELDKVDPELRHSVYPALLGLLAKNTAKYFRDGFFGVPVDASGIQFLATANETAKIKGPLASRFEIFHVPDYSPEQFVTVVVPGIYREWRSEFHEGTFPVNLSRGTCEVIAEEARFVPRRVESVLARLANHGWGEFRPIPTFKSLGNTKEAECESDW